MVRTLALALEELALHGLEVVEVPVELLLGTPLHLAALVLVLTLTSLNLSSLNNIASLVVGVVSLALVVMLLLSALVVAAATAILVISASTLVVVVSVAAASVSAELVVVVASATTAAGCHWLASLSAAPLIFRNGVGRRSQLSISVREVASICHLAISTVIEVTTPLRLILRVNIRKGQTARLLLLRGLLLLCLTL